jgi:hypothetical protein
MGRREEVGHVTRSPSYTWGITCWWQTFQTLWHNFGHRALQSLQCKLMATKKDDFDYSR